MNETDPPITRKDVAQLLIVAAARFSDMGRVDVAKVLAELAAISGHNLPTPCRHNWTDWGHWQSLTSHRPDDLKGCFRFRECTFCEATERQDLVGKIVQMKGKP